MKSWFCPYCRNFKEDEGWKFVVHGKTLSKRRQCTPCQEKRKLPREDLLRLAREEGDARRKSISDATKRGIEERRKNDGEAT